MHVATAAEAAGLPARSHLHDLRGWGATIAARQGAAPRSQYHRLGNASPDAALRHQRAEAIGRHGHELSSG